MSTSATSTPPLYPKKLTRTLILLTEVNSLDEEKYMLSKDPSDNIHAELATLFEEIGIKLLTIDGVKPL